MRACTYKEGQGGFPAPGPIGTPYRDTRDTVGKDSNTGASAGELRVALSLSSGGPVACILTAVERDLGVPVVVPAAVGFPLGVGLAPALCRGPFRGPN
jgi:hypothetical protein